MTKIRKASSLVRLIKKAKTSEIEVTDPLKSDTPTRWSSAVRGWIREFQSGQRTEPLRAFESLFKDART